MATKTNQQAPRIRDLAVPLKGGQAVKGGFIIQVRGSQSADADDRPTEEVAFYYNRIA